MQIATRDVPTPTPQISKSLSPQKLEEHRQAIASSHNRCFLFGEVAYVGLTRGLVAVIDALDFELVRQRKWYTIKCRSHFYACHTVRGRKNQAENVTTMLHRFLTEAKEGQIVDHINGDSLDNRRGNLRICSNKENLYGQKVSKNSTTGVRGVHIAKSGKPFSVLLTKDSRAYYGGKFGTIDEAIRARDVLARKLYGGDFKKWLA